MGFMSALAGIFGGKDKVNAPATPTYYTDPNFTDTQSFLKNYAEQGLQGNMPDWYKQIGEAMPADMINGKENSLNAGILGADAERAALRGTGRGGALSSDTMTAIGNADANLRYSDWQRAMLGRSGLMSDFTNMENGVRSNAVGDMANQNKFDWTKYGADLSRETNRAAQSNAQNMAAWNGVSSMFGEGSGMDISSLLGMNGGSGGGSSSDPLSSMLGTDNLTGENPQTGSSALNFGGTSTGGWSQMIMKLLPMIMGAGA